MKLLQGYVSDMLAVEIEFFNEAFRRQEEDNNELHARRGVRDRPHRGQIIDPHPGIARRAEATGMSLMKGRRSAGVLGAAVGWRPPVALRQHRVAHAARRPCRASFATICYEMLHTTVLAMKAQTAELAIRHISRTTRR